ncbi:hypothetical protein Psuf_090160 [Phytohabitans suffuscus]|uniref:Uncharacterized protein n=1 Tax=Phytohabitans suffuscus TaxID=624315 RepID=A0A6F8Z0D0_9ACTN|nr:hypothetical protein Psuf_090160 [Phytohabitans suffuscus]
MAAGREPGRGGGGHAAQYVEAVRAAVQGGPGLVVAGLGRQVGQRGGRDVRDVRHHDVDPAAQRLGQRRVQVALVDVAAGRGQVAPRAAYRRGVGVRGVDGDRAGGRGHRGGQGAGAAAHVDDRGRGRAAGQQGHRLADQQRGAPARDEDARVDRDPQAAELRPPQQVLQRLAGDPAGDQRGQVGGGVRGGGEQARLVFGEDTTRGAQPLDDRHASRCYAGAPAGHQAQRSRMPSAARRSAMLASASRSRDLAVPSGMLSSSATCR